MSSNQAVWQYLRRDKKTVEGWLQRVDAEISGALLDAQNELGVAGACAEIGVHHGKSFIPLCLSLRPTELALCIDLFEEQARNLDHSGKGDWDAFRANLARFGIDESRVKFLKRSSEFVTADEIISEVGGIRYFSVDGGHWREIVRNDLDLAERTLSTGGVIALDDYCRAEWPEVTIAYVSWQEETESDIIPFAVGSNKLFLCRRPHVEQYRKALATPFLIRYFSKTYALKTGDVDCYRVELKQQDEEPPMNAFRLAMKIFRPEIYLSLSRASTRA